MDINKHKIYAADMLRRPGVKNGFILLPAAQLPATILHDRKGLWIIQSPFLSYSIAVSSYGFIVNTASAPTAIYSLAPWLCTIVPSAVNVPGFITRA